MYFLNIQTQAVVDLRDLKVNNPGVTFPLAGPNDQWLTDNGYGRVIQTGAPAVNPDQVAEQDGFVLDGDVWKTNWVIRTKTEQELAEQADQLLVDLASHRYEIEIGGIEINGIDVSTTDRSKLLINGMFNLATQGDPLDVRKFKTSTGEIEITNTQAIAIAVAVGEHVQHCITAEGIVAGMIGAGTVQTISEMKDAFFLELNTLKGIPNPEPEEEI